MTTATQLQTSEEPRERALECLRLHGWNTTSFQLLETGWQYFFSGDSFVAYHDVGRTWVAGGAPVCPTEQLNQVASEFQQAARAAGRQVCFFAAGERFARATDWTALHIGEQPTWSPATWESVVASKSSLRSQVRRAAAKQVTVRQVAAADLAPGTPVRLAVESLVNAWLESRPMAPMGFLVDVQLFDFASERLFFVAERAGSLVGFLSAVPIYAREGWLFEDLLRSHDAPNGTIEVLIDAGMREAAKRHARLVTLGMAPLAGAVPRGLGWLRELARPLYDFAGVHAFKAKFGPTSWEPLFLLVPPGQSHAQALLNSLRAFARGSFLGFGVQTLVRRPLFLISILTALLAVWLPLIAMSPATYFPAPWVQQTWVGFHAVLVVLLAVLARRYRHGLGMLAAILVSLDAVGSFLAAIAARDLLGGNLFAIGVAFSAFIGPSIAARALWGMVRDQSTVAPTLPRELG